VQLLINLTSIVVAGSLTLAVQLGAQRMSRTRQRTRTRS